MSAAPVAAAAASAARSWSISGLDDSGRLNDTQERLTSRGFGGFGGDDYNPFFRTFQSWFGRADGPSGFGLPGYQSGPFYSDGAGLGHPALAVRLDRRPRTVRRGSPPTGTVSEPQAFKSATIRFFHSGTG